MSTHEETRFTDANNELKSDIVRGPKWATNAGVAMHVLNVHHATTDIRAGNDSKFQQHHVSSSAEVALIRYVPKTLVVCNFLLWGSSFIEFEKLITEPSAKPEISVNL
jgi:hypothetical protein